MEHWHDGDGRSLKQTESVWDSVYNQWTQTKTEYQLWSSVLGSYLSEMTGTGKKSRTKVFAGGAVIAEQSRITFPDNTNVDTVEWLHADPVSGSSTRVNKNGTEYYRTEYEPLGNQQVETHGEYEDFPDPPPGYESLAQADDPEWQCQSARMIGQTFQELPAHCQRAIMQNDPLGNWRWESRPNSGGGAAPPGIVGGGAGPGGSGTGDGTLPVNPSPTSKPQNDEKEAGPIPDSSDPYIDVEIMMMIRQIQSRGRSASPENNIFVGAEFGRANSKKPGLRWFGIHDDQKRAISQALNSFMLSGDCKKAFSDAGVQAVSSQITSGLTFVSEDWVKNSDNDYTWTPDATFAGYLRTRYKSSSTAMDWTTTGAYKGTRYVSITNYGFSGQGDHFVVVLLHALIHSGGKSGRATHNLGRYLYYSRNGNTYTTGTDSIGPNGEKGVKDSEMSTRGDLEWMGEKYNNIIKSCSPGTEPKPGWARGDGS